MKSLSQIPPATSQPRHEQRPLRIRAKAPLIDSAFHPTSDSLRTVTRSIRTAPSFRALSEKFLNAEMKREFASEALLFSVIVGLSGWSIVSLLRAVGGLTI